jgi:hypothetical protein
MPAFGDIPSGAAPFGALQSVETLGVGLGARAEPAMTYPTRSGTLAFEANGYRRLGVARHRRPRPSATLLRAVASRSGAIFAPPTTH